MTFEEIIAELDVAAFEGVWTSPDEFDFFRRVNGAYGVLIALNEPVALNIRNLKAPDVSPGVYLYAGSAYGPGGIGARLARHFKKDKKLHWHVDRLTVEASMLAAFAVPEGQECALVHGLLKTDLFSTAIAGFGSSDCQSCQSHLLSVRSHAKK